MRLCKRAAQARARFVVVKLCCIVRVFVCCTCLCFLFIDVVFMLLFTGARARDVPGDDLLEEREHNNIIKNTNSNVIIISMIIAIDYNIIIILLSLSLTIDVPGDDLLEERDHAGVDGLVGLQAGTAWES